jgi:hypothetical protein
MKGSAHTQYEDVLGATGQIQSIHASPRCTRFSSFPTIVFNSLHFRAVDFTLLGRASRFLGSITAHIHCQVTHCAVPITLNPPVWLRENCRLQMLFMDSDTRTDEKGRKIRTVPTTTSPQLRPHQRGQGPSRRAHIGFALFHNVSSSSQRSVPLLLIH